MEVQVLSSAPLLLISSSNVAQTVQSAILEVQVLSSAPDLLISSSNVAQTVQSALLGVQVCANLLIYSGNVAQTGQSTPHSIFVPNDISTPLIQFVWH